MIDYLAQYHILYKYQSGFRTKHSTNLCLSYLNVKILKGFDIGLLTGMVLIDLQKAFDMIDHNILLEKLRVIGFCDDTVNWFHSYLTNQVFLVSIENKYASILKLLCGMPQGSILGHLLFWYLSMIWNKLCLQICYYTLVTLVLSFNINMSPKLKNTWTMISVTYVNDFLITNQASILERTKLNPFCLVQNVN